MAALEKFGISETSTTESLFYGVPLLALPQMDEQAAGADTLETYLRDLPDQR